MCLWDAERWRNVFNSLISLSTLLMTDWQGELAAAGRKYCTLYEAERGRLRGTLHRARKIQHAEQKWVEGIFGPVALPVLYSRSEWCICKLQVENRKRWDHRDKVFSFPGGLRMSKSPRGGVGDGGGGVEAGRPWTTGCPVWLLSMETSQSARLSLPLLWISKDDRNLTAFSEHDVWLHSR